MFGKKLTTALMLSMVMTAGAQAGGRMDKMIDALDLNEEQITQFKALHQDKRNNKSQHKSERKVMKQDFVDLLDNYSEQQASVLAEKAADMARKQILTRLQQTIKIYNLLDAKQKIKFKEMMKKHGGGKHHWGHKKAHMGHDG